MKNVISCVARQGLRACVVGLGVMNPFVLIELIVFVAAESSIVLERDATHDASTLAIALVGVACFAGLRFALPWAQRSRRRTNAFFVAEMLLLATIAIDQMSAALIITSTSVCIRSAELVRPVRDATSYSAVTLAVVLAAMTYWARTGGVSWPTVGGWIVSMLLAWGLLGVLVTFAANERRINEELRAARRSARRSRTREKPRAWRPSADARASRCSYTMRSAMG